MLVPKKFWIIKVIYYSNYILLGRNLMMKVNKLTEKIRIKSSFKFRHRISFSFSSSCNFLFRVCFLRNLHSLGDKFDLLCIRVMKG